jgi:hypothetical protein
LATHPIRGPSAWPQAVYFVHRNVDAPEHFPNIDLALGQWGEGAEPVNRELVSLAYRPGADGGSFVVIDGQEPRIAEARALNELIWLRAGSQAPTA